ncbi:hypothetical protein FACS1894125_5980 [Actinomycetota bacterium]|nr:hypothetical protein FACS1894125_5980 [Actinomycetota bacterium]
MKIKLAVLDSDGQYVKLLQSSISQKYSDFVDIAVFSTFGSALEYIQAEGVNVLLVDDSAEFSSTELPKRVALGYLMKENSAVEFEGRPALQKYASVDEIYSFVLGLYSESVKNIRFKTDLSKNSFNLFTFSSPNSRAELDATAVGFAKTLATTGAKVLYIDLNTINTASLFLEKTSEKSMGGFSNLIFALKAKQSNLSVAFANAVKTTADGVDFVRSPENPTDFSELNDSEKTTLIRFILAQAQYDFFVANTPFDVGEPEKLLFDQSDQIVITTAGSDFENKLAQFEIDALKNFDKQNDTSYTDKVGVVYIHSEGAPVKSVETTQELASITSLGKITPPELVEAIVNFDVFGIFLARYI